MLGIKNEYHNMPEVRSDIDKLLRPGLVLNIQTGFASDLDADQDRCHTVAPEKMFVCCLYLKSSC